MRKTSYEMSPCGFELVCVYHAIRISAAALAVDMLPQLRHPGDCIVRRCACLRRFEADAVYNAIASSQPGARPLDMFENRHGQVCQDLTFTAAREMRLMRASYLFQICS